jgi:YtkA-like
MAKAALFLILGLVPALACAQAPKADLACKATGTDFIYDCTIRLSRGGRPVEGATVTMSADMPSMPMAHNVKPVKAQAGQAPGEYRAKLDLEMLGVWAVKLRLAGPVRDQLILHYEFDSKGATPAQTTRHPPSGKH